MSASTFIICSKIILILIGAISIAMAVKFSVPSIITFAYYEIPAIWSTVVSWLKPPYIYFIVNGIIIIIAASSRFSFNKPENSENYVQTQPLISGRKRQHAHIVAATIPTQTMPEINVVELPPQLPEVANYEEEEEEEEDDDEISESDIVELKPVVVNGIIEAIEIQKEAYDVVSMYSPPESGHVDGGDLLQPVEKKPLLPSRFDHGRKPVKVLPEGGREARVAKPKRYETLESTWKMITEGKSCTYENEGRHLDVKVSDDYENDDYLLTKHVLKSATFRERTNYGDAPPPCWSSNLGKIKKELSVGQEELNRRVEAFINKFNENLRMQQRQESINQYMEMINRGGAN